METLLNAVDTTPVTTNVLLKDTSCMGYPEQDHLNSRNGQTGLAILNLDLELSET